jgi:hypothetical protein
MRNLILTLMLLGLVIAGCNYLVQYNSLITISGEQ